MEWRAGTLWMRGIVSKCTITVWVTVGQKTGTGVPCPYGWAAISLDLIAGGVRPEGGTRREKDGHGCPVPLRVGGLPFHRIFEDVTACFGELLAVPENPLVIVALLDG